MMRFLKILVFVIGAAFFSSGTFAQAGQPKFSVGFSFGLPSGLHLAARDIVGVQGLGVRADVGGFYLIFFSYLHVAINLEYHFGTAEQGGICVGFGLVVFKRFLDGMESPMTLIFEQFAWKIGAQVYVGFEGENYFLELGLVPIFQLTEVGSFSFVPRVLLGRRFYF